MAFKRLKKFIKTRKAKSIKRDVKKATSAKTTAKYSKPKQVAKTKSKVTKMAKKGKAVQAYQKKPSYTGKIRKGAQSVTQTEGGSYATYKKKSKPAGSFRSAFSTASKAKKKTFMWDGRKYTTKKK